MTPYLKLTRLNPSQIGARSIRGRANLRWHWRRITALMVRSTPMRSTFQKSSISERIRGVSPFFQIIVMYELAVTFLVQSTWGNGCCGIYSMRSSTKRSGETRPIAEISRISPIPLGCSDGMRLHPLLCLPHHHRPRAGLSKHPQR